MTSEKTKGGKRRSSVVIEKNDAASKKARVSGSTEYQGRLKRLAGHANSQKNNTILIYRCVVCTFASVLYDLMIEHCQHHIIDEAQVTIKPITTIETELNDETINFDSHTHKELNESNMNSFMFVDCDYELLKSDKWPGNFETFDKYEIDTINCSSIYYFTRIIQFTSEEKSSFAPFMLYKCMKCVKYIDPHSVLAHVQENSCSKQHKGFSCYECDLPFLTENSMYLHYRTHKVTIPDMKYMTISFNYEADEQMNAIMLKAAGRNIRESGNNNTVQQTPGTVQSQAGTAQQGPGNIAQPQVGVNNTVQQPPGPVQPQGGMNSTLQQSSGTLQPQGGVYGTVQQGSSIAQQQVEVNSTVQQGPGNENQRGGVNSTVQLRLGIAQPQGGVKSTIQQGSGIAQSLGGVNSTAQQTPGPVQPQGGVNSTLQQSPGTLQPQGGVYGTVQQGSSIAQQQVGVNSTVQQVPGNEHQRGGDNSNVQQGVGIAQPQGGVKSTIQQGPGNDHQRGGVNSNVQQGIVIAQQEGGVTSTAQKGPGNIGLSQGGVKSTVQQGSGIAQSLGGINSTVQQTPGPVQPQGGVNSTLQQSPGTLQPQGGGTVQQGSSIAQQQVGVNSTVHQGPGNEHQRGGVKSTVQLGLGIAQPQDKVASVYKCQCDLCFHMLDPLFKHIESCTADLIIKKVTCLCSLVFDEQQYELHDNLHNRGIAKFNVKKVIVCDDKVITSNQHELKENTGTKEDKTKRATKKDTKAKSPKKLNKEAQKIIDVRKNAISQLTTSILNIPSMLTRIGDFKFVKKQQQTAVTNTQAVDPKSVSTSSVFTAVTQIHHEANEERNTIQESNIIVQTDNNVVSDNAVNSDQELAMDENKVINSESSNTEENQYMVDTTIEVELAEINNTYITNHVENSKTLKSNNQDTEAINLQSKKVNESNEIIEEANSISPKNHVNEPELKDVVAENKIYTEDELLNEDELSNEERSVYFDADLLTDDEDPI